MPHIVIEYSANLESDIDIPALVVALHETAVEIPDLPVGGLRTRTARRDQYRIADGHTDNGFINVTLRIAEGRSLEVRQHAGEKLFETLKGFVAPQFEHRPMSLSLDVQEIQTETRWKHSNIRDYMARRLG